jgi:riboflavin kinase/FMN adenylyltransferase
MIEPDVTAVPGLIVSGMLTAVTREPRADPLYFPREMEKKEGIAGLRSLTPGGVMAIGNFDGIHLGHRELLATGDALRARSAYRRVAIVTFEPHPFTVLRPELAPPRLTPAHEKERLLAEAGVDDYVVLPPAPEVLNLSAEDFWAVLRDEVRPAHLVEGDSFTFGKGRGGTVARLREWSRGSGVQLHVVPPVDATLRDLSIVPVSSSMIRWLVAYGRVRDAAICLGRPYALHGDVVRGFGRGRQLGVPTANLHCDDQLIPADGVYAGRCTVDGRSYPTAVSIGSLPTFEQRKFQVEAHLIGFAGDLYGRVLEVELIDWVREQWKFTGVDALKSQIARDLDVVRERAA